jgi:hypothetical protein
MSPVKAKGSIFTRHHRDEVAMALSAMECVLNGQKAIYASSELTSGRRVYDILEKHGLWKKEDLQKKLKKTKYKSIVSDPNVQEARNFASRILQDPRGGPPVISPAPFEAPGWSQEEYLEFWKTVIQKHVRATWFNENWEFSNGCTFEFFVSLEAGLPTFDHHGNPLSCEEGINLIQAAMSRLAPYKYDLSKLKRNLATCQRVNSGSRSASGSRQVLAS